MTEVLVFLTIFTLIHVLLSLVGIVSGLVVMLGFVVNRKLGASATVFLSTTVATSVTGFGFPFVRFTPAHALGILSLLVLTVAIVAQYGFKLMRSWRGIYVVTTMVALYFNVFVLVVQSFEKVATLRALAPTQSEPPFAITQLILLVLFVVLAIVGVIRFQNGGRPARAAAVELQRA
jgi:hypothetical protein